MRAIGAPCNAVKQQAFVATIKRCTWNKCVLLTRMAYRPGPAQRHIWAGPATAQMHKTIATRLHPAPDPTMSTRGGQRELSKLAGAGEAGPRRPQHSELVAACVYPA